jgi:TRAP-type C4-dicarboxylate transport system substrate-binding protein
MKVKKVLSMFLVFIMAVMIVACNNQAVQETPEAPEEEPEVSEKPAEKPDKQYVLKHCHVLSASEPFHQGFLNWAKAVEERTNGGLKIEVFPAAQSISTIVNPLFTASTAFLSKGISPTKSILLS